MNPACPLQVIARARPGDPVRRGPSAQALTSLEYSMPRLKRGMTAENMAPPSRDGFRPSLDRFHPLKTEGAGKAGCPPHPRLPVHEKKHGEGTTGEGGNIRPSLRDGFNAYSALSLGTGLSCSHRPRDHLARLASASGGQDHTILRPLQCRSSARRVARVAKASIASRAQRS